ncbi:MAG: tRNA preQ1(34) S-adenosylmethionine ribosyltransferase-isomerase QueA [bacterium]|nr:tRNA preQ1(34) S-adenosylmethionine ribosyltransferase-isomerase QueA [bacterium]
MAKLEDFNFDLPEDRIAIRPEEPKDASRLMACRAGGVFEDWRFFDLPQLLEPGSLLVVNDAKVIPARLLGSRKSGAALEALLLKELSPGRWAALLKKAAKIKPGEELDFFGGVLRAIFEGRTAEGESILIFQQPELLFERLEAHAQAPIPPYIHKARKTQVDPAVDRAAYQTVFARQYGAVAAPTAGLHMTQRVLAALHERQVELCPVTLDVGLGTFEPVRVQDLTEHVMHQETFEISETAALKINQAKAEGRPVVALGTTSLRTLEAAAEAGRVVPGRRATRIFIYPPYQFQIATRLVTNFHLPQSTLLMLVSAFAGRELIMEAYRTAIERRYRFYSYGDAMLLG